jgi:hypothetical protein
MFFHIYFYSLLSVRNIKSLIITLVITLNTKTDQEIREYYITLEEIFYSYLEYTKKCYLNIGESLEKIVR